MLLSTDSVLMLSKGATGLDAANTAGSAEGGSLSSSSIWLTTMVGTGVGGVEASALGTVDASPSTGSTLTTTPSLAGLIPGKGRRSMAMSDPAALGSTI